MSHWALYFAGAAACVFAVLMVLQRSLYMSAICLLMVVFQAAVIFFFAGAPLLAFLQIMIYAGAVMVLIVVAIMAAPSPSQERWSRLSAPRPVLAAVFLLPFAEVFLLLWRGGLPAGAGLGAAAVQLRIGPVLFQSYGLATEAVTLLLFLSALAVVGKAAPGEGR